MKTRILYAWTKYALDWKSILALQSEKCFIVEQKSSIWCEGLHGFARKCRLKPRSS